jgi:hypothetical protein
VGLEFGQRRPNEPGRPITLADGQVVDRVDISLPVGGVIAGRVLDDTGEPLAGAVRQRYVPQFSASIKHSRSPTIYDHTTHPAWP